MATSDPKTLVLPDAQYVELEKLARAQERTVDDVLADAVDRYIKEKQWVSLKRYGRAKSRELGLTEGDVPRLIEESRQEHGR